MFTEDYKWNYDYVRLAHDTGFSFEKHKTENIDEHKISLVDVDRVIQERDFATIEKFIPTITKFVLDPKQSHILDVSFVKTFRLSQLTIQYLLYCKKYLDNSLELIKTGIKKVEEENKELNLFVDDLKAHIDQLMREIDEKSSYKCEQCTKMFSTQEFLNSHIKRRHSVPSSGAETDKLQMEIKELKGRLNSAEQLIHKEHKPEVDLNESRKIEELQQKFEELRLQIQSELKILQTRHNFQEKYDKLIEKMAFQGGDLGQRRESATQTDVAVVLGAGDNIASSKFEEKNKENIPETSSQKYISQFEEALETKVSTSLERIEKQMQTFWSKLGEIEKHKNLHESATGSHDQKATYKRNLHDKTSTVNKNISKADVHTNAAKHERKKEVDVQRSVDVYKHIVDVRGVQKPLVVASDVQNCSVEVEDKITKIESGIQMIDSEDTTISETVVSEVEAMGDSHDDDSIKSDPKPVPAPRKRPLPSDNPANEVDLQNFRSDIEKQIAIRLQDLGVSPDWTGLPTRSFQRALEIVNHQASLTKKSYPNFDFISAQIEKNIDVKLNTTTVKKSKQPKDVIKTKQKATKQKNLKVESKPQTSAAKVEIKYRSMYETDSESEAKSVQVAERMKQFSVPYSAVIEELKAVTTNKNIELEGGNSGEEGIAMKNEEQTKGVLKSYPSVGSLTKKKVLFNLDDDGKDLSVKNDGSSTSIASSVFDGTPRRNEDKPSKKAKDVEDLSDFDFSDM